MARRRRRRPRRNSDKRTRDLERKAASTGDPFDYARYAQAVVRRGAADVRLQGWALLTGVSGPTLGPTGNIEYYEFSPPIRVFLGLHGDRQAPVDITSVRINPLAHSKTALEFHTVNPRARSAVNSMGLLHIAKPKPEDARWWDKPASYLRSLGARGADWAEVLSIAPQEAGAKPKRKARTPKANRPIRLGTKRSKRIFDAGLGGFSYSLYYNFHPQPLSAEYVREKLEADARKSEKSMRPEGGGKYGIHYHSNHWVEFWSDAEQEVSAEDRERLGAIQPEPTMAPAPAHAQPLKPYLVVNTVTEETVSAHGWEDEATAAMMALPEGPWGVVDDRNEWRTGGRDYHPWEAAQVRRAAEAGAIPESMAPAQPAPAPAVAAPAPKRKRTSRKRKQSWLEQLAPEAHAAYEAEKAAAPPAPAQPVQAELWETFEPDPEAVAAYEERLEAKRERLEDRAAAARGRSSSAFGQERGILGRIPMGQPILVGHHSERRHRRDLARARKLMETGLEQAELAESLERRAQRVGKGAVSSDDPAAVVKLRNKLAALEANRDHMKDVNKRVRAAARKLKVKTKGIDAETAARVLEQAGVSGAEAANLVQSYQLQPYHGLGYASYNLTNTGAEIRRVKKRLEALVKQAQRAPAADVEHEGFRIVEDTDINRLQLMFDGKPGEQTRKALKGRGFRWSRRNQAWQRQLTDNARAAAQMIAQEIEGHGGWLQNPGPASPAVIAADAVTAWALGRTHELPPFLADAVGAPDPYADRMFWAGELLNMIPGLDLDTAEDAVAALRAGVTLCEWTEGSGLCGEQPYTNPPKKPRGKCALTLRPARYSGGIYAEGTFGKLGPYPDERSALGAACLRLGRPMNNPERVTFGKMEQWEPGESEGDIYLDGAEVGTITGHYHDFSSGFGSEFRVVAYTAEVWPPGSGQSITLEVRVPGVIQRWPDGGRPGEPGAARTALSTLRKRVRDTLDPKLERMRKGVYGPPQMRPRKNPWW